MRWLSLPIPVLVLALLTSSAACVARCVGVSCHIATEAAKLPPCHKEKTAPVEPCKQSVLIAVTESLTLTKPAIIDCSAVGISGEGSSLAFPESATNVVRESTSPPGRPDLRFSVVLRI